jgi:hypothetical protein
MADWFWLIKSSEQAERIQIWESDPLWQAYELYQCPGTVCNPIPKIIKMQCVSTIHHFQIRMRSLNQRRSETKCQLPYKLASLCAHSIQFYIGIYNSCLPCSCSRDRLWESQIDLGLCFIWLLQSLVLNWKGTGDSFSYTVSWRDMGLTRIWTTNENFLWTNNINYKLLWRLKERVYYY